MCCSLRVVAGAGPAHSLDRPSLPGDALSHLQGQVPNGAFGHVGLLGPLAGAGNQLPGANWPSGQLEGLGHPAGPGPRPQSQALFGQASEPLPYVQPQLQPQPWRDVTESHMDESQMLRLLQLAGQPAPASTTSVQPDLAALLQHSAPNTAHPLAAAASSALYQGLPLDGLRGGWPLSAALTPAAQTPQRLGPLSHSVPPPPLTEDALAILQQHQALGLAPVC